MSSGRPGMKGLSKSIGAHGVDFEALILLVISLATAQREKRER